MEQQIYLEFKRARRTLITSLVCVIAAISGAVLVSAGSDMEPVVGDLSRIATISAAAALSLVVIARQNVTGLFGKAYASLAAGLILWVIAESIWGYSELVLGIETRSTSIADWFWISAYGPFAYHLFSTARFFGKGVKKSTIVIVTTASALFLAFYIQVVVDASELTGPDALATLGVSIAYPVLDAILIVPAVLVVLNAGKGQLTSIPWIFVGWILLVLADSLLGVAAVNGMSEIFHITMAYNAAYLCFAAGLLWYNKQFLFNT